MSRKRPYSAFVAAFGALLAAPAFAADLTIPSGPHAATHIAAVRAPGAASQMAGKVHITDARASHAPVQTENNRLLIVQASKGKRAEKGRQRKIRTYSLFNDPVFKLAGAVTDKRHFGALPGGATPGIAGLGSGFGYSMPAGMAAMPPNGTPRGPAGPALKMETADSAGLEFGCREKAFSPGPVRLGVTACYRHKLDKSWKTQTFVSKGIADGGRDWGGGLSVSYAH